MRRQQYGPKREEVQRKTLEFLAKGGVISKEKAHVCDNTYASYLTVNAPQRNEVFSRSKEYLNRKSLDSKIRVI